MQMEETDFVSAGSEGLAEDTGGFALKSTNDLAGGAARVAHESRVYYLLGYAPPEGKGPRDWRKLKVEVGRPGLKVRARQGYSLRTAEEIGRPPRSATEKGEEGRGRHPPPSLPPDMRRALATAHDLDAIPLRAMAYVFRQAPRDSTRAAGLRGGPWQPRQPGRRGATPGRPLLSIAATHRDTGKTERRRPASWPWTPAWVGASSGGCL